MHLVYYYPYFTCLCTIWPYHPYFFNLLTCTCLLGHYKLDNSFPSTACMPLKGLPNIFIIMVIFYYNELYMNSNYLWLSSCDCFSYARGCLSRFVSLSRCFSHGCACE